jgi:hypothetical protein
MRMLEKTKDPNYVLETPFLKYHHKATARRNKENPKLPVYLDPDPRYDI